MSSQQRGAVLAFDFGTRKIGVAVGDWETRMAHPLEVIRGEANDPRFARIAALIDEWRPSQLVAGMPLSLDGEEHDLTRRARRFANQLNGRFNLPVILVDERLTSVEADSRLREAGVKAASRKQVEDSVAAQQILQDHFDHYPHPQPLMEPLTNRLAACRTLGADSENRPQRGQFLPDLPPYSPAMGQKSGEKWTAAVDLQPTIPKSDGLLGHPETAAESLVISRPRKRGAS